MAGIRPMAVETKRKPALCEAKVLPHWLTSVQDHLKRRLNDPYPKIVAVQLTAPRLGPGIGTAVPPLDGVR